MAVSVPIYSNTNGTSKTVSVDFVGDILAASFDPSSNTGSVEYYFKFTTGARDTDNITLPVKIVKGLDDLALNHIKQSATDTANVYTDVHSMVIDYIFDYINGHVADQYSSGVKQQKRMKFD